jgi:hypothetical protein
MPFRHSSRYQIVNAGWIRVKVIYLEHLYVSHFKDMSLDKMRGFSNIYRTKSKQKKSFFKYEKNSKDKIQKAVSLLWNIICYH